jgi:Holliday junction DNA helicase RuvA
MLSSLEPQQIQRAIVSEDLNTIKSVKGIGLKTAQRVLIELKDKMMNLFEGEEIQILGNNTIKDEALSALEVLGYSRKQSERIVDGIIQSTPDCSVEELIKEALNKL